MAVLLKRRSSAGKKVEDTKIADETVSALKVVTATSQTNLKLADKSSFTDAQSLGVSISSGNMGEKIKFVSFGQIDDSSFNFPLKEPLFLGDNGLITATPPTTGFVTTVGYSLGLGSIFVDIEEPIELC